MSVNLYDIFERFCEHIDGRLKWGDSLRMRTKFILDFFKDYMGSQGFDKPHVDYMEIDAIWRDPHLGYIVLALEHENKRDVQDFITREIRHLVDLKSRNKVAVAYPHTGDQSQTLNAIINLIQQNVNMTPDLFGENYLILFGFNTWHAKKPAIQWKGYFIDHKGTIRDEREKVVLQKSRQ